MRRFLLAALVAMLATPAAAQQATFLTSLFLPCIPSSAINTNIVVTSAAPGAGGTVSVTAWGYTQ